MCPSLNHIGFLTEDDEHCSIWFDGDAFICTDEGKAVRRLHRAGFTMSVLTDDVAVSDDIAAKLIATSSLLA